MNLKNNLLYLMILSCNLLLAQRKGIPSAPSHTKCYIRCVTPASFESTEHSFPVFMGEPATNTVTDTIELELMPQIGTWQYELNKLGCKSLDPEDCLVLCYVETRAIKKSIVVVVDTSATDDYEWQTFTTQHLIDKGGVAVWEEIDCHYTEENLLSVSFELNSDYMYEESEEVLENELLSLMLERPNIRVKISAHTDARGDNAQNLQISLLRAQAIADYLCSKGIQKSRLIVRGYGETRPLNDCIDGVQCSEKEHKKNERITFRVISN